MDNTERTKDEIWTFLSFFLGEWQGSGRGQLGISRTQRRYRLVLNDQFIEVWNRSIYEPQEKNPQGEVHEDLGFFSFDNAREKVIFREFHVEGYVNQYVLTYWDREKGIVTFETEAIENILPGWCARTTYLVVGDDTFIETFDLAGPDQAWTCYITNEFDREKGE